MKKKHLKTIGMSLSLVLVAFFLYKGSWTQTPEEFTTKENLVTPSIIDPQYVSTQEADLLLENTELGVSYNQNGLERFYPYDSQEWNLIQVSTDKPYLVTYCEICHIAVIYNPILNGNLYHFETTQFSNDKNSVIQDKETKSYWSQLFGEATHGELEGEKLETIFHQNMSWKDWKLKYPEGEVMIIN